MTTSPDDLVVLYEDNHLLAVVKPCGLLTMGDETGDESLADLAKRYLKERYQKPGEVFLGVVHRLDRPVSGVVLFARTSKAAARLSAQFRERETGKTYHAIVSPPPSPPSGRPIDFLLKDSATNVVQVVSPSTPGCREAILRYNVLKQVGPRALVEVLPETGRGHQIRVQMAHLGAPIVGDVKYGGERYPGFGGQIALHAISLECAHPVGNGPLKFTAPVPANWAVMLGGSLSR